MAIGPIYETQSKENKYSPRGLDKITQWRSLVPPDTPIIAIGGISLKVCELALVFIRLFYQYIDSLFIIFFQTARDVITAGADGIAAIKCIMDGKPPPFTPTLYTPNMNQHMALKSRFTNST